MVGPVLHQEVLLGSRRSRGYVFRWLYAGWLVLQLLVIYWMCWWDYLRHPKPASITSAVADSFTNLFLVQQMILMLLAVPVFVAGAVTDEKSRGTLQYLLTSDLWSWHIILGKLLGRVLEVALLILTGLPLLCFLGVFAGLEPLTLLALIVVTLVPMGAIGAASLLASVWCKQTRDAVLSLYAIGAVGCLLVWLVNGLHLFNPVYVLQPAWGQAELPDIRELGSRLLVFGLLWGGLAVVCLSLAVWRLRPAYVRQLEGEGKKKRAYWWRVDRVAIGDEPVRWKEQHVDGLAPVTVLRRFPRWLALLLVFTATLISSIFILWLHRNPGVTFADMVRQAANLKYANLAGMVTNAPKGFLIQSIVAMLLASLVVGIRCSGAVSGERERQTWEALLLTPLTARQLIRGKLWGIMGSSYIYLLAYAVPALVLAAVPALDFDLGDLLAAFWTTVWLAVTWLAMYYIGAAGVWCSVRSKSSWRSLLGTLGLGYLGGFVIAAVTSPVTLILAGIIYAILTLIDSYYGTAATRAVGGWAQFSTAFFIALCLVLAAIFYGLSQYFILDAQKWVADRERTRHWKEEPVYPRTRQRPVRSRYYR